jgi:hypothetical protein
MKRFLDDLRSFVLKQVYSDVTSDTKCTRRGLCGKLNIEKLYCKEIKKHFHGKEISGENGIKMMHILHPEEVFIKTCCICEFKPTSTCISKKGEYCDGHYILIISKTDRDTIDHDNDYVLDVTYKQMLITRNQESQSISKQRFANSLPDVLLIEFREYENYVDKLQGDSKIGIKERWHENIKNPLKFIITKICPNKYHGKGRKTKKKRYRNKI